LKKKEEKNKMGEMGGRKTLLLANNSKIKVLLLTDNSYELHRE
jgi:hypothetical protein